METSQNIDAMSTNKAYKYFGGKKERKIDH